MDEKYYFYNHCLNNFGNTQVPIHKFDHDKYKELILNFMVKKINYSQLKTTVHEQFQIRVQQ